MRNADHPTQILIGNGAEKRGLIDNVWNSKTCRTKRGVSIEIDPETKDYAKHDPWIFDGNRLAW